MSTLFTKARTLFLGRLKISLVYQILSLLLFMVVTASCSKDSDPQEVTIEESKEQEEEPIKEEPEEETPQTTSQSDINTVDTAVANFMAKYGVPGAAIAVSVNEKLVYSKGYGVSNVENNTPTKADALFRIASISKPFTATAILKLIDEGKIALTDKVFGPTGVLGDDFGTAVFTQNALDITIDHLLIHGSGGWGTVSGDPIDYEPQLDSDDFIEYILNNWDLPNAPGSQFEYSNTGYWLLARIVERVSGEPFETYVKNMLAPTGITSFKTTTFRPEDRESNEVDYYGTSQDMQWIYTIASRRDGDGGVVISAPDLLRFLCAIDGSGARQDVISTNSQNLLSQPSNISNLGRGLGTWQEQGLLFFTGSLPGTRTWFYMAESGVNVVLLLNYRRTDIATFDNDLNSLVYNIVKDNTIPWQTDLDQF